MIHRKEPVTLGLLLVAVLTRLVNEYLPPEALALVPVEYQGEIVTYAALGILALLARFSVVSPETHEREKLRVGEQLRDIEAEKARRAARGNGARAAVAGVMLGALLLWPAAADAQLREAFEQLAGEAEQIAREAEQSGREAAGDGLRAVADTVDGGGQSGPAAPVGRYEGGSQIRAFDWIIMGIVLLAVAAGVAAYLHTRPKEAGDGAGDRMTQIASEAFGVVVMGGLFVAAAYLAQLYEHQEFIAQVRAPEIEGVLNQRHMWAKSAADGFLAMLLGVVVDRVLNREALFSEVVSNRALPGREHVFVPLEPTAQAGMLIYYGLRQAGLFYVVAYGLGS